MKEVHLRYGDPEAVPVWVVSGQLFTWEPEDKRWRHEARVWAVCDNAELAKQVVQSVHAEGNSARAMKFKLRTGSVLNWESREDLKRRLDAENGESPKGTTRSEASPEAEEA